MMAHFAAPFCSPIVSKLIHKALDVLNCVRKYQTHLSTLQKQQEVLQARYLDDKREAGVAESKCREITEEVKKWVADVEELDVKIKECLDSHSAPTPYYNCSRRYKTGKEAKKLVKDIENLINRNNKNRNVDFEPNPPSLAESGFAEGCKAIASREMYVKSILDVLVGGEVLVIGVHGVKGVGKTMLVKKLAVEMESTRHFNGVVVTNAETGETEKGLSDMQNQIAERFGFNLKAKIVAERAMWLNQMLKKKDKVLIIIDGLHKKIGLNMIGIPQPDRSNNCRMVVVSSSLTECRMMKATKNFEIKPLSPDESSNFFDELAREYHEIIGPSDFEKAKDDILSKSKGLPGQIQVKFDEFVGTSPPTTNSVVTKSDITAKKNVKLFAKLLRIEHIHERQCWRWTPSPSAYSMEAILIQVWYLYIAGKAKEEWLSPATHYGAYFIYKLDWNAKGFNTNSVKCSVGSSSKYCWLDPSKADALQKENGIGERDMPMRRQDEWLEIEMGTFYNVGTSNAEHEFFVRDHGNNVCMSGLRVRCIELRPLNN